MNDKTLIVVCYNTENMTLIEACLTHNVPDDFKIRIETNLGIKVDNGADIFNVYARLSAFGIDIFGELVHIVD